MIRRVVLLWLKFGFSPKSIKVYYTPALKVYWYTYTCWNHRLFFYLYCIFFALPILILWIFLKICIICIYDFKKSAPSIVKYMLDNFFSILEVSFFNLMGFDQSIRLLWGIIINWVIMPISLCSLILSIHLSIYIFHPSPKFAYLLCLKAHLRC